jgi:hypothetical protein
MMPYLLVKDALPPSAQFHCISDDREILDIEYEGDTVVIQVTSLLFGHIVSCRVRLDELKEALAKLEE